MYKLLIYTLCSAALLCPDHMREADLTATNERSIRAILEEVFLSASTLCTVSPVHRLFFISFKYFVLSNGWKSYCSNCLHLNTWWQERRWAFWHKSVEHEIDLWTSVSTRLYITAGSHHTNALLNVTIERFLTEKSWRTQSASTHPSMKHSWTDGCFLDDRESTSLQITETLTLQSLAYVQEEERKIWAADDCVWSSLSVIQHCVSPTSDRIYSRCSTRILWALGNSDTSWDWLSLCFTFWTYIHHRASR